MISEVSDIKNLIFSYGLTSPQETLTPPPGGIRPQFGNHGPVNLTESMAASIF
jgi:hypothetical protein